MTPKKAERTCDTYPGGNCTSGRSNTLERRVRRNMRQLLMDDDDYPERIRRPWVAKSTVAVSLWFIEQGAYTNR
jgi:hypothetical protein